MRRFEHATEKKFWQLQLEGSLYKYSFGKIGSNGQTKIKRCADEASAKADAEAAIADKKKQGYVEVGGAAAAVEAPSAAKAPAPKVAPKPAPAAPPVRGWQFVRPNGEVVLPGPYELAHGFRGGVANVRVSGKWGMIDREGRFVVAPRYQVVFPSHQGLSGFKDDDKVGYLDTTGRVVIAPQFDEATNFDIPGVPLALFSLDDAWGVIRTDGSVFVPAEWNGVAVGKDGWVRTVRKGLSGFVDANGKRVIDVKFRCDNFKEDRALVNVNGKFGFLGRDGAFAIEPIYDNGSGFSEGLAWMQKGKKYGAIDRDGKVVIDFAFEGVVDFADGRAFAWEGDEVTLIDRTGKTVGSQTFGDGNPFESGTAVVGKTSEGPFGLVDKDGNVVVPLEYKSIDGLVGGHRKVCKTTKDGDRYGYVDAKGAIVCDPRFLDAQPLPEDLAAVETMIAGAPVSVVLVAALPEPQRPPPVSDASGDDSDRLVLDAAEVRRRASLRPRPPLVDAIIPVAGDPAAIRKALRADGAFDHLDACVWWWLDALGPRAAQPLGIVAEQLLARLKKTNDWSGRQPLLKGIEEVRNGIDAISSFEAATVRARLWGFILAPEKHLTRSLRALALAAADETVPVHEVAAQSFARIEAAHPGAVKAALKEVPADEAAGFRAVALIRGLGIPDAEGADVPAIGTPEGKLKKLPDFWEPATFARPLLAGRKKALPLATVEHIGEHLEVGDFDATALKRVCDPASLRDFAWSVFDAWLRGSAPSKQKWALTMLGDFGDDTTVAKLAPMIGEWPGQSAHARAVLGLSVLAKIGTDRALGAIHRLSQRAKFGGLKGEAQIAIARVAQQRGLTQEELADRLVPDFDLEDDGTMTLDFGGRTFRVGFDESLKPYVVDADDKRHDDLPKPKQTDDATKAAEAVATWKNLKKEVRAIASLQVERLERAMCTRRRWHLSSFRLYFVEHPLLRNLAHRLVWGVFRNGKLEQTFRVAQDDSFANASDETVTIAEDAEVGIVHPLDLDAATLAKWSESLASYDILQPFEQLGRRVHAITPEETSSKTLRRFEGRKVKAGAVMGLLSRGWSRGSVEDNGVVYELDHALGSMTLEPGIYFGVASDQEDQTLSAITLRQTDPVGFSELVRSLERLST